MIRTIEEIEENLADGIRISEFPVTMEAAQAARARGMATVAGAPNIVRGGSHSGNVKVADLLRADAVDALASDYVPASLVEAVFLCASDSVASPPARCGRTGNRPSGPAGAAAGSRPHRGGDARRPGAGARARRAAGGAAGLARRRTGGVNRGDARVAVYYGPARGDVLWQRGANWLGRDPAGDAAQSFSQPGAS